MTLEKLANVLKRPIVINLKSKKIQYVIISLIIIVSILIYIRTKIQYISNFSPKNETKIDSNVVFEFNLPVVDKKLKGQYFSDFPIKFHPPTNGLYKWETVKKLVFYPSQPLLPSTDYRVFILPEIIGITKKSLKGKKVFGFTTERFRVNQVSAFIERQLPLKDIVRIKVGIDFNFPVDYKNIGDNIKLLDIDEQSIEFTIDPSIDNKRLILVIPSISFGKKDNYCLIVFINKNLICVNGTYGLEEDYKEILTIETRKELIVKEIDKVISGIDENTITLEFSASVNPIDIERLYNHRTFRRVSY